MHLFTYLCAEFNDKVGPGNLLVLYGYTSANIGMFSLWHIRFLYTLNIKRKLIALGRENENTKREKKNGKNVCDTRSEGSGNGSYPVDGSSKRYWRKWHLERYARNFVQ